MDHCPSPLRGRGVPCLTSCVLQSRPMARAKTVCLVVCVRKANCSVEDHGTGASFHPVGSRDDTEVVRLGSKCLSPLSHTASPKLQT